MAWRVARGDTRVTGNMIVRKEVEVAGCFCYTEDDFRLAQLGKRGQWNLQTRGSTCDR